MNNLFIFIFFSSLDRNQCKILLYRNWPIWQQLSLLSSCFLKAS